MEINLMELWGQMGLPVKVVVVVLTLQAIACITVAIDRLIVLYQSTQRARQFAGVAQGSMQSGHYDQVLRSISDTPANHLTGFLDVGIRCFLTRRGAGDDVKEAAELTRRALERKGDAISRDLNRGMNVLASTGSTAPFVGLLGTVLGIIHAFKLIAADGSGGIGTIGAAIGEALVVTGYGLMVAIPSVLLFNWLSSMIAKYEAGLINAGGELIDQLETSKAMPGAEAASEALTRAYSQPAPAEGLGYDAEATPVHHEPAAAQPAMQLRQAGARADYHSQPTREYPSQPAPTYPPRVAHEAYVTHQSGPVPAAQQAPSVPPLPRASSAPAASRLSDRLQRVRTRTATGR